MVPEGCSDVACLPMTGSRRMGSESPGRSRILRFAMALVLVSSAAPIFPAAVEQALKAEWEGRWVIVGPQISSDCVGFYTNNVIRNGRVEKASGSRISRLLGQLNPEAPSPVLARPVTASARVAEVHFRVSSKICN